MTTELSIITRDLQMISTNLAESLHLDDVIYTLLEKKKISLQVYDKFMKGSESDLSRAESVVKHVAKNPQTISDFIEALLKEGLKEIAFHISPIVVESLLPSIAGKGMKTEMLPFIASKGNAPCSPLTPQEPMRMAPAFSFPDVYNENMALKILVKSCNRIYGNESNNKDVYKNSSRPQGFIFIANFESFDNNTYAPRPGSNIDVKNLQELFTQIGYVVVGPYINPTKFELVKAIEKFREMEELVNIDSCVVAIMSHGKGEVAFLTSDNKILKYLEVLELFNNKQCPMLFGKPKVFIFQCCRGAVSDEGVGICPLNVSYSRETLTDAAFFGQTLAVSSIPSFTDMFIIQSSLEGFVSYRCPDRGSWLIEALCIEFMENACEKDLESLMRLVSRRLKSLYSDKGKKQICECRNVGFDKLLYFNPISTPGLSELQGFDEPDGISRGSASHFKTFRINRAEMHIQSASTHKRQLSNLCGTDGVMLCDSLMENLQVNDMPDMLVLAEEIKNRIQTQKIQNKRRKPEYDENEIHST